MGMERSPDQRYCSFFVNLQEGVKPAAAGGVYWVLRGIRKIPTTKPLSQLNGECFAEYVRDKLLDPANPQRIEASGFCPECRYNVSIVAKTELPPPPPQD